MTEHELLDLIDSWENLELIIATLDRQPEVFPVVMKVALYSKHPKSWRAAWIADKYHDNHPGQLLPFLDEIILVLKRESHHGKKRQFLKLISLNTPDERHHPFLMDYCLDAFTNGMEPVGIRVYALQILFNISEKEPDFKAELLAVIEHEMELHPSPGIRAKGRNLAQCLARQIVQS